MSKENAAKAVEKTPELEERRLMLQEIIKFAAPIYEFIAKIPKTSSPKIYHIGLKVASRNAGENNFELSKPYLTLEAVSDPAEGEIVYPKLEPVKEAAT